METWSSVTIYSVVTRIYSVVTRIYSVVTRIYSVVTRIYSVVTRIYSVVTRICSVVTRTSRNSCFLHKDKYIIPENKEKRNKWRLSKSRL